MGDLPDFDSLSTALNGVTRGLLHVSDSGSRHSRRHSNLRAGVNRKEGVGLIVNMSQIAARKVAKSHASQDHWIAERSTTTKTPSRYAAAGSKEERRYF